VKSKILINGSDSLQKVGSLRRWWEKYGGSEEVEYEVDGVKGGHIHTSK